MIEYEKINLTSTCGCGKKEKSHSMGCNKIDIPCSTPLYFRVDNYFGELVHEWEKEAARYNLGVLELEGIEYVTESKEGEELLTKVIFKYRKGHEVFTREFICAPKGETGEPGRDGDVGPLGPKGDPGQAPHLTRVVLTWVSNCGEEGGTFDPDPNYANSYYLNLKLKRPDTIDELSRILDEINRTLASNYVTREQLNDILDDYSLNDLSGLTLLYNASRLRLQLRFKNLNLGEVIDLSIPEYTLSSNNNTLNLLKDGQILSSVNFGNVFGTLQGDTVDIRYIAYTAQLPAAPGSIGAPNWGTTMPITSIQYPYVWMAIRKNDGPWNIVRLTGENNTNGSNGVNTAIDYDGVDFVFVNTSTMLDDSTNTSLTGTINADTTYLNTNYPTSPVAYEINNKTYKVSGNASGITLEKPYEYIGIRVKSGGKFVLNMLTLWSVWGKSGKDGAYVEYIYIRSSADTSNPVWTGTSNVNPQNWSNNADFQNPDYTGPNISSNLVNGNWSDEPMNPTSNYPFVYCSSRKYDGEKFLGFSTPALWSMWVDTEKGNSDIILVGDLPVITCVKDSSVIDIPHTLHLTAYNGTEELTILGYKLPDSSSFTNYHNGIDLSSILTPSVSGTRQHTFIVNIELPESLLSSGNSTTLRTYTVLETVIENAVSGAEGVSYKLIVDPSTITFNDNDELVSNIIKYKILKNGVEITYKYNTSWKVSVLSGKTGKIVTYYYVDPNDTIYNNQKVNITDNRFYYDNDKNLTNGHYFLLTLEINGNVWDVVKIPVIKNVLRPTSPYIVRNVGKWKSNVIYYGVNQNTASSNIKYVDVVYTESTDANDNRIETYWMCMPTSCVGKDPTITSNQYSANNTSGYWLKAYSIDFAYIRTLIADVISATSLLGKEVLVKNENDKIVAGITSGNRINDTNEDGLAVRIWAGTTTIKDDNDKVESSDLTNAPFRVYENGNVVANNVKINGEGKFDSLETYQIKYLNGTTSNPYVININDYQAYKMYFIYVGDNVKVKYTASSTIKIHNNIISEDTNLASNSIYIVLNFDTHILFYKINLERIVPSVVNVNVNITPTITEGNYVPREHEHTYNISKSYSDVNAQVSNDTDGNGSIVLGAKLVFSNPTVPYEVCTRSNPSATIMQLSDCYKKTNAIFTESIGFNWKNPNALNSIAGLTIENNSSNFSKDDVILYPYMFPGKNTLDGGGYYRFPGSNTWYQCKIRDWSDTGDDSNRTRAYNFANAFATYLKNYCKPLILITVTEYLTPTKTLGNGTIINEETGAVVGYLDEETASLNYSFTVHNYTNRTLLVNYNSIVYRVESDDEIVPINTNTPDPEPIEPNNP